LRFSVQGSKVQGSGFKGSGFRVQRFKVRVSARPLEVKRHPDQIRNYAFSETILAKRGPFGAAKSLAVQSRRF
jgi:hypothetical protein